MARRSVLVSDLSGEEIPDGKGATVTINFRDARRGSIVLDVTDAEAEKMGKNGRKQGRRGRRPKEAAAGSRPIEAVGTSIAGFVGLRPEKRSSGRSRRGSSNARSSSK
jgi:hypothetical protein